MPIEKNILPGDLNGVEVRERVDPFRLKINVLCKGLERIIYLMQKSHRLLFI